MNAAQTEITPEELQRYEQLQQQALDFARAGDTDALELMVQAGLPADLSDHKGNSLLMLACYYQNLDTARMLLDHGATPNSRNDRGQTPLGGVAFKGYADIAELLIGHGADVNADQGGGKAPLIFATLFGRLATRRILKRHGAKLWSSTPKTIKGRLRRTVPSR